MGFKLKKVFKSPGHLLAAAANPLAYLGTAGKTGMIGDAALNLIKGPKIPTPPGMSAAEAAAYQKQQELLGQAGTNLKDSTNLYHQFSGLYNPDGTLNNDAVSKRGSEMEQIRSGEAQRYQRALSGTGPVSEGLRQDESNAWSNFVNDQARRGNAISGSGFDNASAQTTAGAQALAMQGKRFDLAKDNERMAELQRAPAAYANSMGFAANAAAQPSAMNGDYQSLGQSYQQSAQPFQAQRELEYNGQLAKAGAKAGQTHDLLGLAGTIGGALIGGPAGAAAGGAIAGQIAPQQSGMGFSGGSGRASAQTRFGRVPTAPANYWSSRSMGPTAQAGLGFGQFQVAPAGYASQYGGY